MIFLAYILLLSAVLLFGLFVCFFSNIRFPTPFFLKFKNQLFRFFGMGTYSASKENEDPDRKDASTPLVNLFLAALTQTGVLIALNREKGVDQLAILFYVVAMSVTVLLMWFVIRVEKNDGVRAVDQGTIRLGYRTMFATVLILVFATGLAGFGNLPFQETYQGSVNYTFKNSPGNGAELTFVLAQSKISNWEPQKGNLVPALLSIDFTNAISPTWSVSKDIVVSRTPEFDEKIDTIRRLSVGNQLVWDLNLENTDGPVHVKIRLKHHGLSDRLDDDRKLLDKLIGGEDAIKVGFTYLITDEQLQKNAKNFK